MRFQAPALQLDRIALPNARLRNSFRPEHTSNGTSNNARRPSYGPRWFRECGGPCLRACRLKNPVHVLSLREKGEEEGRSDAAGIFELRVGGSGAGLGGGGRYDGLPSG